MVESDGGFARKGRPSMGAKIVAISRITIIAGSMPVLPALISNDFREQLGQPG
jgi:hypothetical protein